MKIFLPLLFALSSILSFTLSAPVSALELQPFSHKYKSTFAGFRATSTRTLTQLEDDLWELRMSSKNMLARYEEISRFKLDSTGYPIPLENRVEGKLFGSKRLEVTQFDWAARTATWTRKNDQRTVPIDDGVLDRILYQLLLPQDAALGAENASYNFINRGQQKTYDFERLGIESVSIGDQDFEAVKMRRVSDNQEKETTVWLALELNYELIKIYHHDEDGADYKMELKRD